MDGTGARFLVAAAAAFTDWLDGRLARGGGQVTRFGELLDPIADKTFMVVALATLVAEGLLPLWTLPLLLVRDIGVAAGALFMVARGSRMRMPARRPGKIVTWIQFTAVGVLLLWPAAALWVALAVAATGLWALRDYALAARRSGAGSVG